MPLYSLSTAFVENAQTLLPHSLEILEHTGISTGLSRITPANAWNTPHNSPRCSRPGDHPRVRGEGTSLDTGPIFWRDHPRVRGEGVTLNPSKVKLLGSPPRSRGRPVEVDGTDVQGGITPAFAGKAAIVDTGRTMPSDHPRVRGEGLRYHVQDHRRRGSPPRSRGRPAQRRQELALVGITPAFAGKATTRGNRSGAPRDHPRVRGEGSISPSAVARLVGSPPRSRGRQLLDPAPEIIDGITPAFAGKASRRSDPRP